MPDVFTVFLNKDDDDDDDWFSPPHLPPPPLPISRCYWVPPLQDPIKKNFVYHPLDLICGSVLVPCKPAL